jgi:ribonuclease HI
VAASANTTDVWIHGACAGGGYGGWSYVVREGEQWRGAAGGATRTDAEAMALTGLVAAIEALGEASKAGQLALHLTDVAMLNGSDTHPELARRLAKRLADRSGALKVVEAKTAANAAAWTAFLASWADFARDRAKTRGAFSAPIPKLNVAKFAQDAI